MLSVSIPPRVRPMENPIGWPPPMAAKAKLRRFPSRVDVIMLTADGRQKAIAIPLRPRKIMSWIALCERPQPRVKTVCKIDPTMYMNLEPNASAMEPDNRRRHPHVSACMDDGLSIESVHARNL